MRKQMTEEEVTDFIRKIDSAFESELVLEGLLFAKDEKRDAIKIFLFTGSHLPKVALEWIGQHFATVEADNAINLSIEGAQTVGVTAKKTINLTNNEAEDLFAGRDIEPKTKTADGYYLIKRGENILGAGKIENNKIISPIPKSRRTRQQYQKEEE
jgi:NOL1/NOP2/fmu family ribosome biogenesis protein